MVSSWLQFGVAPISGEGGPFRKSRARSTLLFAFGEQLMPLLAKAGVDPGDPQVFEVHNITRR